MNRHSVWAMLLALVVGVTQLGSTGCGVTNLMPSRTIHHRCGWKAEDFFTDPLVIALCHAIEASDLAEMDRLLKAGADVNAQGRGKMTPLLWAYPDNKLPRFKLLLEHGANPNVVIESDFNTRNVMNPGDSVTLMACRTTFPGYFDAVFDHGGDPNIRHTGPLGFQATPLFEVIKKPHANRKDKVARLIAMGADMNALAAGETPLMCAVGRSGGCEIILFMLESGADHRAYNEGNTSRLIHVLAKVERLLGSWEPESRAQFHQVVEWLEDHGESYEVAKADLKRWDSWSRTSGEFRRKMDSEIAEREAKETEAKAQQ